jgi:bifunctional non-homologous end joining protein LigD
LTERDSRCLYSRNGYEWTKRLAGLAGALGGISWRCATIDAQLVFPNAGSAPNYAGLQEAVTDGRQHGLAVIAFDALHRDGWGLQPLPLIERRRHLEQLLASSTVPCLHLIEAFGDGAKLLETAERMQLEGIVSKRRAAPYRSGESNDWRKVKTLAWHEANREPWRLSDGIHRKW